MEEPEHEDGDEARMPLIEHLIELRNRLVYAVAALLVGVVICYFFSQHIYSFLTQPLADILTGQGRKMIFTGLTAYDTQRIKSEFYAGNGPEIASKQATFGAVSLYLNFLNIFLFLLQLFGNNRN